MAAIEEERLPQKIKIEAAVNGEEEDDEHDSKERVLQRYFLQEWKLVKSLLDDIVSNGRVVDPSSVQKIQSIMDKYQEQGQLVEPYLESIVSPLMLIIRSKTAELDARSHEILEIIKPICIIIYTLVTVCGYKAIIKFFPHQVSDLELAVSLLEKCHSTTSVSSLRQESTGEMEAKCVTLLWLSILVLVPFDISSVDTSIANDKNFGADDLAPFVLKILGFCKDYLCNSGPMRRISGLLLSKLLTRPDMGKAFTSFVEWTHEVLSTKEDSVLNHFRLLGVMEALAAIFKTASRKVLLDVLPTVLNDVTASLSENISTSTSSTQRLAPDHAVPTVSQPESSEDQEDEEMDVPEILEDIIEMLLSGLRDTDTVVRWSAAKGIGRVTSRLTSILSEEVLSSVLELFSECVGNKRVEEYTENGIVVWSGNDDQCHGSRWDHGATGVISVTSNLVPGLMRELMFEGRNSALNSKLLPIMDWLFQEPNPIGVNTALSQLGVARPVFRLPYVPLPLPKRLEFVKLVKEIVREHFVGERDVQVLVDDRLHFDPAIFCWYGS